MKGEYLEYSSKLAYNREVFLIHYGEELAMFEESNMLLENLKLFISKTKDKEGHSHVSLLSFIGVIKRQATIAFDRITQYQSFTAWIIFRPALESVLIIGKLIDDPNISEIWRNRKDNKRKFKEEFTGKGLISKCLPQAKEFRNLLTKINDEFVHSNWNYLRKNYQTRQVGNGSTEYKIPYIDRNFLEHRAYLYSFLNIYRLMIVSLGKALVAKFGNEKELQIDYDKMKMVLEPKVMKLAEEHPNLREILTVFGLWNL